LAAAPLGSTGETAFYRVIKQACIIVFQHRCFNQKYFKTGILGESFRRFFIDEQRSGTSNT
jgi:hypothetical protein